MNNLGSFKTNSAASNLLVLRHSSNSVGIVHSVAPHGNLIELEHDSNGVDIMIRIDSSAGSFMDFYADFYHQLKNPDEFSFFKVMEFEADEAARDLQEYVNSSSTIERKELKKDEVSIDTVNALRNNKNLDIDGVAQENSYKKLSSVAVNSKYRYQVEDVNWSALAEIGLSKKCKSSAKSRH
ncbi:hypothetical protein [Chryseobacterium balustinum]|uniref:hypothetical protein n=1 Tax=Chryseobacterium balustinum TaxID=246 RepID=UPI003CFAEA8B